MYPIEDVRIIDVSLAESTLAFITPEVDKYYRRGESSKAEFIGSGVYGTFKTKDNGYIVLAFMENQFWEKFCETVGMKAFLMDGMFNSWIKRIEYAEIINNHIASILVKKTLAEWLTTFDNEGLPISPINIIKD